LQESAQILLAGRGTVVERLEVMSGPTGRRSWTEAAKARIVAASFEPGTRVVDVARRHGVAPQQVTAWRRDARQGRLVLPVEGAGPFAALVVEDPLTSMPPPSALHSMIEIEIDGVVVRLAADAPAVRVAEIAAALRGPR
jgi:transposase